MLVKAEILWTRECPLRCGYCAMVSDMQRAPVDKMCQGVARLAALDCCFAAIYGASPLFDFDGLPEFVRALYDHAIPMTIIVDGMSCTHPIERIDELYGAGLRSLTVSWDGYNPVDKSSQAKSLSGLELARWAKAQYPDFRDVQLTSTVSRQNITQLIEAVPAMVHEGFWYSFDLVHPSRGQEGSKCRGDQTGLVFTDCDEDKANIRAFVKMLLQLKRETRRVHQSVAFLLYLISRDSLRLDWVCTDESNFPTWLTIDADGTVRPCDDFCLTTEELKVWDLTADSLETWSKRNRLHIIKHCPGCLWSTHWDACAILDNRVPLEGYVHKSRLA